MRSYSSLEMLVCGLAVDEAISSSFVLVHMNIGLESNKAGASMSYEHCETHCKKVLSNGDVYVGDFDGLLPDGMGRYTWTDGTIYHGQWEESKITGRGKIFWPSGATYEGELCGGFLHGAGTLFGVDGSTYRGSWRMNKQHGKGIKLYSNLDEYDGLWREGLQEGIGTYRWSNGNTYSGNWKTGKMSGKGVMKWANGDLFDGNWLDGLENGSGYYKYADGSIYVGIWSRGLKDGHGTFFPAGSRLPYQHRYSEYIVYGNKVQSLGPTSLFSKRRKKVNRWNMIGYLRNPKRISHRPSFLDGVWNTGDACESSLSDNTPYALCSSTDEGRHGLRNDSVLVYDREYMQGVLITESMRYYDFRRSQKNKWHCKMKKQPRGPGETIYKGHRSYYLMLNLQLGIRYTVGKITPVPMREVRSSDFGTRARIRMYFPSKGSQFTPPHSSIGFFWKDYCPMVFRNLREMFKIDAADYMMSICGGDGLKKWTSQWVLIVLTNPHSAFLLCNFFPVIASKSALISSLVRERRNLSLFLLLFAASSSSSACRPLDRRHLSSSAWLVEATGAAAALNLVVIVIVIVFSTFGTLVPATASSSCGIVAATAAGSGYRREAKNLKNQTNSDDSKVFRGSLMDYRSAVRTPATVPNRLQNRIVRK
ncbi:hypothetical protein OPV22_034921 [Ensete ventricosum]|uniref:1-phosphatidylinositol-4-phosphate 5-kinase n=1 Tax=Ensete ventricosum TaxID=4639 RepID=A0AAV8P0M1_ENSVE|nr:hypothetical protein OPV22_034921 [Ensete ventricosum]